MFLLFFVSLALFCDAVLTVLSSFAVISLMKRVPVALLYSCSSCRGSNSVRVSSSWCRAVGWSVVCDCGIFWSYSLAFYPFKSAHHNKSRLLLSSAEMFEKFFDCRNSLIWVHIFCPYTYIILSDNDGIIMQQTTLSRQHFQMTFAGAKRVNFNC